MGTTITDAAAEPWLAFFLQTSDALFPTGAYAHSLGFEECVRLELVRDEPSLARFLALHLLPALERQELPYLRLAYEAAAEHDIARLCEIDAEISACKLAHETRTASTQLGRRRLKALQTISSSPLLEEFQGRIDRGAAAGHHLTVTALQAIAGGIPLQAALTAYGYQSFAAICAAALKLIRIGQDACQRVLHGAAAEIPAAVAGSLAVPRDDAGWFDPLLEIGSMRHEFAEERLFIS